MIRALKIIGTALMVVMSLGSTGQAAEKVELPPVVGYVNKEINIDVDFNKYNKDGVSLDDIKKEIDKQNKFIKNVHENIIRTKNGVKIFTYEDIKGLDQASNNIVLLQEIMRRKVEKDLVEFREVRFPLVSEIEQYGVPTWYTESLYTDKLFSKEESEGYKDTKVDYDFFKEITLEQFIEFVEALDFINLENTQVIFHPYRILSGYAYCEGYAPEGMNIRRTRIYYNPVEGENIASTLYHELGHMIYLELVENNKENYDKYYNIYKSEFDTHNGADSYGRWDKKLTENFAEDFKIYVSKKVMLKNDALGKIINDNKNSFLGKDTVYSVKPETDKYFDDILKKHSISTEKLRPDISVKLGDYKEEFILHDNSYLGQHANKIVTNSNEIILKFSGGSSELKPLKYYLHDIDKETYSVKSTKEYKINDGTTQLDIKIKGKKIYELEIEFGNTKDYKEKVKYFIIKM